MTNSTPRQTGYVFRQTGDSGFRRHWTEWVMLGRGYAGPPATPSRSTIESKINWQSRGVFRLSRARLTIDLTDIATRPCDNSDSENVGEGTTGNGHSERG